MGADLVAQCARRGSRLAPNPKDAYLAFAAASAVLQFVEHGGVSRPTHDTAASALSHRFEPFPLHESTRASPGTVVVTCSRSEHFINLDPTTARVLEIATPLGPNGEPAREPTRGGQTLSSKPVVGKFLSTHVWAISMTSCFVYRPDIRSRRRSPTRRHELTAPIATRLAGHVRHERRVAAHEGVAASALTGPRDDRDETRRRGGGTFIFISVRAIELTSCFCFFLSTVAVFRNPGRRVPPSAARDVGEEGRRGGDVHVRAAAEAPGFERDGTRRHPSGWRKHSCVIVDRRQPGESRVEDPDTSGHATRARGSPAARRRRARYHLRAAKRDRGRPSGPFLRRFLEAHRGGFRSRHGGW